LLNTLIIDLYIYIPDLHLGNVGLADQEDAHDVITGPVRTGPG
jgi:hypothetical protein